jgi:Clustered mitochondria
MEETAKRLNLKGHFAGLGISRKYLCAAVDVEVHRGTDSLWYMLDLSRTFPPTGPNRQVTNGHLYQLFRAEFLHKYPHPLCSDAFSGFIRHDPQRREHNTEVGG